MELHVNLYSLFAVILALTASTLWSQAYIDPIRVDSDVMISRPWEDTYFHACQVRAFRDSHGASTLQHISLSGQPQPFYHYAGYLAPAALAAWTSTPTFLAFASFATPLGLFLNGLAAFALARYWWGQRAGIGAVVALLLLPGAPYHGLDNRYLGFHWSQLSHPSMANGVCVAALAWIFLMEGCRRGRFRLIAIGYFIAGLTIIFKAHIFIAISLLAWLYPPIFMRRIDRRWRVAWFALALFAFVACVAVSQRAERVPTLRFDSSSMKAYMNYINAFTESDRIRNFFAGRFAAESPRRYVAAAGAALLFFGTFGWLGIDYLVMASFFRRKMRPAVWLFPLLVIANYLVMAMFLAFDSSGIGSPVELKHRPFAWAYFVIATWIGGVIGRILLGGRGGRTPVRHAVLLLLAFNLLSIPFVGGHDVHRGPRLYSKYSEQAVRQGLVDCCLFIRDHSVPGDIVQDSSDDLEFKVSGLSECQDFASSHFVRAPNMKAPDGLRERLDDLRSFRRLTDWRAAREFASRNQIAWFLLHPEDQVNWPSSLSAHLAAESKGYRVYCFKEGFESHGPRQAWVGRLGKYRAFALSETQ